MKLQTIDKATYRKNLNIVIVLFIASFTALAIIFGAILIQFFGNADGDNFILNLLGVIFAFMICGSVIMKAKSSPFFHEIYYVWQLKQLQNRIYRCLKKVKKAAEQDDIHAYVTLNFYYESQLQVYQLDDNTITINELTQKRERLLEEAAEKKLNISEITFESSFIEAYK